MLEYLRIQNFGLIEDMELEFAPGINVLTGETGAGKSFILKALGFVLGDKSNSEIVRQGKDKALVEAFFSTAGEELILRRELHSANGRSRFFLNDSLHSQESVRSIRARLVSHTSQHDQQQLLQPGFQASLIEGLFPNSAMLEQRDAELAELQKISRTRADLAAKQKNLAERRELLEMQQLEIAKVAPRPGEEEELEALRNSARDRENTLKNCAQMSSLLHGEGFPGLLDLTADLEKLVRRMCAQNSQLEGSAASLVAFREELFELERMIRKPGAENEKIDLDKIEGRLFALAQLKRRLKRNLPEILAMSKEIEDNLSFLDECALDLAQLAKEEKEGLAALETSIKKILPLRREAAANFARNLEAQLRGLGFSEQIKVIPDFLAHEIWPGVHDERARLLWTPNPGQSPQPLDRIASGGELSRFLLALVSLSAGPDSKTYIFDEVDAGVGGLTLHKLADKLEELAGRSQMILITHWPQLAARAKRHFQIVKEIVSGDTYTHCKVLDERSRVLELGRMAGGGQAGEMLAHNYLKK